jgi:hypothetical protein
VASQSGVAALLPRLEGDVEPAPGAGRPIGDVDRFHLRPDNLHANESQVDES